MHIQIWKYIKKSWKIKRSRIIIFAKQLNLILIMQIAYFIYINLEYSNKNKKLKEKLFSENFLNNKIKKEKLIFTLQETQIFFIMKKY